MQLMGWQKSLSVSTSSSAILLIASVDALKTRDERYPVWRTRGTLASVVLLSLYIYMCVYVHVYIVPTTHFATLISTARKTTKR